MPYDSLGRSANGTGLSVATLLAVGLAACGGSGQGAGASRGSVAQASVVVRPDLRLDRAAAIRGTRTLRITATVRNQGRARSARSSVAFYLSRDRKRDAADRAIGSIELRALRAGATATVHGILPLPVGLRSGASVLIGCADVRHRQREVSEQNNCARSVLRPAAQRSTADGTPPRFGGLASATTCAPGPRGGAALTSRFQLHWNPASDDTTAPAAIVYEIYQASKPGAYTFGRPTYLTPAGATSFTTPPLPGAQAWYFVVRGRDAAGNRDTNEVERAGDDVCR